MVNVDPTIQVTFEQIGCILFCEDIQTYGYHFQLASLFSLSLKVDQVKIGDLEFKV